jgi:hypothetical protein
MPCPRLGRGILNLSVEQLVLAREPVQARQMGRRTFLKVRFGSPGFAKFAGV